MGSCAWTRLGRVCGARRVASAHLALSLVLTTPPSLHWQTLYTRIHSYNCCFDAQIWWEMDDDYYSIESILAENQKIQCTFKVDVPDMGHLDGGKSGDVRLHTQTT